uniref:Uncharacterized protein n=1 Tax=Tetraselmis sp. GSL018 TaxID=582737 RepID=A0A061SG52_9CHLO|mmetsp:Transcript_1153/g.2744  ORF Transcript_1153/g.2744 Transcript_1153/m.2744 type:complete len:241 (+) Transcript_1153:392-1114(+)
MNTYAYVLLFVFLSFFFTFLYLNFNSIPKTVPDNTVSQTKPASTKRRRKSVKKKHGRRDSDTGGRNSKVETPGTVGDAFEQTGAAPQDKDSDALQPGSGTEDSEEDGEDNQQFLGIDDVLPSTRGAYVIDSHPSESRRDSLSDGWETVDHAKYNIPRGSTVNAQGLPVPQAGDARGGAPAGGPPPRPKMTKNEKRRQKEQIVRELRQRSAPGASVAQRIGSRSGPRALKDPSERSTVPGM